MYIMDINENQLIKEMEFQLDAQCIQGQQLAAVLADYRVEGDLPELHNIQGLFKGFIDLIFMHNDQYYVLDYKSNFLGFDASSYNQQSMLEAMQDHCYDLQYLLYLAAVQRYLRSRLADYDYDRDIGGVYYLFLRGMSKGCDHGIYFSKPDRQIIDQLDQFFDAKPNQSAYEHQGR